MAKKYIDADLLREGLKELESVIYSNELVGQSMHPYDGGQLHAIKFVKELIDSLQQEQSCDTCTNDKGCVTCKDGELWKGKEQPSEDLEEEIKRYIPRDQCPVPDFMEAVARHFAEWQKEQMLQLAKNRYEQAMTFVSGNLDVDHALQMDRLALVKIIEEGK